MSTLLDDPLLEYDESLSDGCTCAPDFDFVKCCVIHDEDYWRASTEQERKVADDAFYYCIKSHGIEKGNKWLYTIIAFIYWSAVRVFGKYFWIDKPNQFNKSIFKSPGFKALSKTLKIILRISLILLGAFSLLLFVLYAIRKNRNIL